MITGQIDDSKNHAESAVEVIGQTWHLLTGDRPSRACRLKRPEATLWA